MAESKQCADCHHIRPLEAFYTTRGGAGRSERCKDCIEIRAEAHRADKRRKLEAEDAELEAFMLLSPNPNRPIPSHLAAAVKRLEPVPTRNRKEPPLSNRPHMTRCAGCGESVPKRELYGYRVRGRAKYCVPCMKRRATERECEDCNETKLAHEFFRGLGNVSPHCCACREKRGLEKRCPRCDVIKPLEEFTRSGGRPAGWCKQCSVEAQRERRAAARSQPD